MDAVVKQTHRFRSGPDDISVTLREVLRGDYGLYTWPSSVVLARHLFRHRRRYLRPVPAVDVAGEVVGERPVRVLELGSGTGLPGLLLARLGAHVTLTDAVDQPEVLANLEAACRDNGLVVIPWPAQKPSESRRGDPASGEAAPGSVSVSGLSWGRTDASALELASRAFDLVVGADVLYAKGRDFDHLLATVRLLLERAEGPGATFVTAYQHRSAHRSLEAFIELWGLEVTRVWQLGEEQGGEEEEEEEDRDADRDTGGVAVDVVEIRIKRG